MTKQHVAFAAGLVDTIRKGAWTHDAPSWSPIGAYLADTRHDIRAIQTAEAFILLFTEHNPRFDRARFLDACGLGSKPTACFGASHES